MLTLLVQEEVYAAAAELRSTSRSTTTRCEAGSPSCWGPTDPEQVYAQLAQQGISREDVFENVRQQLVRQEIAADQGKAAGLDDAALQARYAQVREGLAQISFGYITVPDDATAHDARAADRRPVDYAALAAAYPGPYTLRRSRAVPRTSCPACSPRGITAAKPNTGFTTPVARRPAAWS